jgi:hypothetical protein
MGKAKIPHMGYEMDTLLGKREIAQVQLVEAIRLFVNENFLCAITLSGAAEEILARIINSTGGLSSVERAAKEVKKLQEKGVTGVMGNMSGKHLYNLWNHGRNTVKHHNSKDDESVVMNLFDEAYWMIRRALDNALILEIPVENRLDFERYCLIKIH